MDYTDKKRFPHGIITAAVTPFKNTEIDYSALKLMLGRQIKAGVDGIVLLGTTGESPTVSAKERSRLIEFAKECIDKRTFFIVGCGGADTRTAQEQAKEAYQRGADGILCVTPYYNRPPQDGIVRHYLTVAEETELPLMMYNVPSRTGVSITCKTAEVLFSHENITALKEASSDIYDITEKLTALSGFDVFCGNDELLLPFLSLGAVGCVSVISNALPCAYKTVYDKFLLNKTDEARDAFVRIRPLLKSLSKSTNPVGIKALLAYLDLCSPDVRLPLVKGDDGELHEIIKAYSETGYVL